VKRESSARSLGSEAGWIIVVALWVLLIVGLLGGAALALSVRSIHTSQVDRDRDLALGAADAGADEVGWLMNKLLTPDPASLLGVTPSLGCVYLGSNKAVTVGQATTSVNGSLTVGTCTSGASQTAGNGATYTYVLQTDINLSNQKTLGTSIVERRLLVIGAAYQRYRRILVTYRMNTSLSSPLFERYRYVECSATNDTSVNIAGNFNGCADPGA